MEPSEKSISAKIDAITKEVFEWVDAIAVSIIVVVLVFTFLLRVVGVDGPSMQNTLFTNDKVIITHLNYKPKQGDIVVVSRNYANNLEDRSRDSTPIIKRIIALENQTVDIDPETNEVSVDGKILIEPYIKTPTDIREGISYPFTVPSGHIFVMGDNRANSADSRSVEIGAVDERYILGKAIFRIFPIKGFGALK